MTMHAYRQTCADTIQCACTCTSAQVITSIFVRQKISHMAWRLACQFIPRVQRAVNMQRCTGIDLFEIIEVCKYMCVCACMNGLRQMSPSLSSTDCHSFLQPSPTIKLTTHSKEQGACFHINVLHAVATLAKKQGKLLQAALRYSQCQFLLKMSLGKVPELSSDAAVMSSMDHTTPHHTGLATQIQLR